MLNWIVTAIFAFAATNVDDLLILVLFFSQLNTSFRPQHVVAGQYLGFAVLIVAGLPGFFGRLIIPEAWLGLLGLLPILIGIRKLFDHRAASSNGRRQIYQQRSAVFRLPGRNLLHPQVANVAAVTIANGGDNIAIYTSLFAGSTAGELIVILGIFFILIGVWCFAGYHLACRAAVAAVLARYGRLLVPFVLISLGIFILYRSGILAIW